MTLAPLTDPDRLAAYQDALSNWSFEGYVAFECLTESAFAWVRQELENITLRDIARLMFEHVEAGGEIDEVKETRPEWSDQYEFHYDLRVSIQDKPIYIETRMHCRIPFRPDDSWIDVVNIHAR